MLEYKEGVDLMSSTGNRYSNEFKQQKGNYLLGEEMIMVRLEMVM